MGMETLLREKARQIQPKPVIKQDNAALTHEPRITSSHVIGRPHKEIDLNIVRKLAKIHCTHEEIATFLNVGLDTLRRHSGFQDVYKKGLAVGKRSLRRIMYAKAKAGDNTMLIWLSKQYLDMHEPLREVAVGGRGDGKPVEIIQKFDPGVVSSALGVLISSGALRDYSEVFVRDTVPSTN
ncbi:hypothetical protein ES708_12018 [subsurface metagenome]